MTQAGLCATCLHCRLVQTGRSTFYLCQRSFTDPRYRKYPVVPVLACPGHEPRTPETDSGSTGSPGSSGS